MVLPSNFEVREKIACAHSYAEFRVAAQEIKARYLPYHEGKKVYEWEVAKKEKTAMDTDSEILDYNLRIPPWICQSYVRAPPEEHKRKLERHEALAADPNVAKKKFFDDKGNEISRKRMKKMRRVNRRPEAKPEGSHDRCTELCPKCNQPKGVKCMWCRPCCKERCQKEIVDCVPHKMLIKTKKERKERLAMVSENKISNDAIFDKAV